MKMKWKVYSLDSRGSLSFPRQSFRKPLCSCDVAGSFYPVAKICFSGLCWTIYTLIFKLFTLQLKRRGWTGSLVHEKLFSVYFRWCQSFLWTWMNQLCSVIFLTPWELWIGNMELQSTWNKLQWWKMTKCVSWWSHYNPKCCSLSHRSHVVCITLYVFSFPSPIYTVCPYSLILFFVSLF